MKGNGETSINHTRIESYIDVEEELCLDSSGKLDWSLEILDAVIYKNEARNMGTILVY